MALKLEHIFNKMGKIKIKKFKHKKLLIDEEGNEISNGWDNIYFFYENKNLEDFYYIAYDGNSKKEAIFRGDNKDKPTTKWYDAIFTDGFIINPDFKFYIVNNKDEYAIFKYPEEMVIPFVAWRCLKQMIVLENGNILLEKEEKIIKAIFEKPKDK